MVAKPTGKEGVLTHTKNGLHAYQSWCTCGTCVQETMQQAFKATICKECGTPVKGRVHMLHLGRGSMCRSCWLKLRRTRVMGSSSEHRAVMGTKTQTCSSQKRALIHLDSAYPPQPPDNCQICDIVIKWQTDIGLHRSCPYLRCCSHLPSVQCTKNAVKHVLVKQVPCIVDDTVV